MGSEESQTDAVRTVECLRGRLLAERVASKAAKEEADLMAKRLSELERLVAAEVEARNRAEKRLDRALRKLESLKLDEIPGISEELRARIAVASGAESSPSSSASACSSATQASEERKPCSQDEGSAKCGSEEGKGDESQEAGGGGEGEDSPVGALSTESSVRQSVSEEDGDCSSVGTAQSVNNNKADDGGSLEATGSEKSRGGEDSAADANSGQPSFSNEEHIEDDQKTEYSADDTLALVPAGIWLSSGNNESSTDNKRGTIGNCESPSDGFYSAKSTLQQGNSKSANNVHGVLSALKLVKEQLQSSIDGRAFSVCSPAELCSQ